ncbi:HAD-IA family hydrolase [Devosia nitrariae]|uniref:Haloacid dehalogenase n=1 Tax=Devosia nitrariae TaxID=2071872 RepID=A0ABQ5W6L8_9HYPH|nr:HAD-IA family hydrolase [Devosia nitrariae]GLQ55715.1 haloacid dehalogenase [Devosia nitrariae]
MRTIMMDVDGVLVCGRPQDGAHLFTDLKQDLGIPPDVLQREFFRPRWSAIVTGQKALVPELSEVLAVIAPTVSAEALIDYWFVNDSRINQDVLRAIGELRAAGDRVYLATNQEHMRANYLMTDMGLEGHVDGIFYSAVLGHRKPSNEFYTLATEAAGTPPESIVLIDDTQDNVLAARDFGWNAVHWRPGMTLSGELAAFTS